MGRFGLAAVAACAVLAASQASAAVTVVGDITFDPGAGGPSPGGLFGADYVEDDAYVFLRYSGPHDIASIDAGALNVEAGGEPVLFFVYPGIVVTGTSPYTFDFSHAHVASVSVLSFDLDASAPIYVGRNNSGLFPIPIAEVTPDPSPGFQTIDFTAYSDQRSYPLYFWSPSGQPFSLDNIQYAGSTPEPTTWALMLSGFFGLGEAIRRRRYCGTFPLAPIQ